MYVGCVRGAGYCVVPIDCTRFVCMVCACGGVLSFHQNCFLLAALVRHRF